MLTFAFATLLTLAPQQEAPVATPSCATTVYEDGTVRGTGACVLEYQGMRFESDWIIYERSTGDVSAGDHVHFTRGAENIDGSHLEMNANTKAGTIWDATGKVDPGFHLKAKVALRFEDETWEFHNTIITACESAQPCWTIALGRAWFRPGEWVKGKSSMFRFHDLPVFWLPYVVAPSETKDRATGFLIPSISKSSSKGRGFREEFFYAINNSADLSFTGEYFSLRGPTGEIGFRAKPTSTGWVSVNSFFARDRLKQGGHSLRILAFSNFGPYTRAVVDLETESSETFRQVWGEGFAAIATPINKSVGFLTTNKPNSSFNVLYSRSEFLHTAPSTALRKFPSFEVSLPSREFSLLFPAYFRFEGSISGISRRDAVIATPAFGGRFDLHPSVQMPILRLNAFELSQEVGARETEYSYSLRPDVQQNALNRFTMDYSARFSGPEFEKSYGKWRHSIQPTAEYRYVTGAERFREAIIVDDVDLVANTSELEYGVTSRIIGSREFLSWRLAQVAYFNPSFGGAIRSGQRNVFNPLLSLTGFSFSDGPRHYSPIVSTLNLAPTASNGLEVQLDYDTQLHKLRSAAITTVVRKGMWGSSVLYAFTGTSALQTSSNQVHGALTYGTGVNHGFTFSTNVSYDVQQRLFQGATTSVGYNAECYGLSLIYSQVNLGVRQDHKWQFALSLKNIGAFGNIKRPDRVF